MVGVTGSIPVAPTIPMVLRAALARRHIGHAVAPCLILTRTALRGDATGKNDPREDAHGEELSRIARFVLERLRCSAGGRTARTEPHRADRRIRGGQPHP